MPRRKPSSKLALSTLETQDPQLRRCHPKNTHIALQDPTVLVPQQKLRS